MTPEQTGGGTLTVTDAGLGFPDAAVFERGTSRAGSSGLGLDIAQRLARASGGWAHISTSLGGAQVWLSMGGPAAAPGEPGLA